jgi:hypothetical protein
MMFDELSGRKLKRKTSPKQNLTPMGNNVKVMKMKRDEVNFLPGGQYAT